MTDEMPDEKIRNPEGLDWSELVGKYVLIGITIQDLRGKHIERKQFHGRITATDSQKGLRMVLEGKRAGEIYDLPPDLRSLRPAPRGKYRLRATGETIRDPDYLFTWILEQPDD